MMNATSTLRLPALLLLLCLLLALTACGSPPPSADVPDAGEPVRKEDDVPPEDEEASLSSLLGEDYQSYITETITMQMGNRMDKNPEVIYLPIAENQPLTEYVSIGETTSYAVNEKGDVEITFPAGTVTDTAHGEQTFILPRP